VFIDPPSILDVNAKIDVDSEKCVVLIFREKTVGVNDGLTSRRHATYKLPKFMLTNICPILLYCIS